MPILIKFLVSNAGAILHLAVKVFEYATTRKQKPIECEKKKDGKPN